MHPAQHLQNLWFALGPATGFLPAVAPSDSVPAPLQPWLEAADVLPEHYHGEGLTVRPWLDERFGQWDPTLTPLVQGLAQPERDRLMTAVSVLCHAYRWDNTPPRRAAYDLQRIDLPAGLREPWQLLATALDQPRVGNLYNMVLCNWRLAGVADGAAYSWRDVTPERLQPRFVWLQGEQRVGLEAFLCTALETEARGIPVIQTVVDAVQAAARRDIPRAIFLLERLRVELGHLAEVFKRRIHKHHMPYADFLRLIQPTTIWGLDEGDGPLEGASGPQVGALQCVDALLGVQRQSAMGQAILHSRRYLPRPQRDFLDAVEAAAPEFAGFVAASGDPRLIGEFNGVITLLRNWRLVHKVRAAMYLRSEPGTEPAGYASTGGVVALDSDRVRVFEQMMDGRVDELLQAGIAPPADNGALEAWHRYLWPEDRQRLREAATPCEFDAGQQVLMAGTRRAGLWLVVEGLVEVRIGAKVVAQLGPGQVFGEMSFLEVAETSADIYASEDSTVAHLTAEQVFGLVELDPAFGTRFYQSLAALLSRRLRAMNEQMGR